MRPPYQPCAGGLVHDAAGRILLIERGHPPAAGTWSVPGGRCRTGETPAQACVREVHEETGLRVAVISFVGRVLRAAPTGATYVIDDFACRVLGGELRAGDDAADARWIDADAVTALPLAPLLRETLSAWNLLPR